MEQPEIILNLWYVVDDLGVIYSLRVRAYIGTGTDADKLKLLQKFAITDYLIAKAFPIPESFHVNGIAVFHQSALDLLPIKAALFEEAIQQIQSELPSQTPFDIPDKPLVCITPLLGDDDGNVTPLFNGQHYLK